MLLNIYIFFRSVAQLVERRSPKPEVAGSMPATPAKTVKKNMKFNPAKYLREVRQEVSKVTWPSKRETFTSAGIVLVVISIAAIILMLLDQFFSFIVRIVLG